MLENNKGFVIYLEPTISVKDIYIKMDDKFIELNLFEVNLNYYFVCSSNENILLDQISNPLIWTPERPWTQLRASSKFCSTPTKIFICFEDPKKISKCVNSLPLINIVLVLVLKMWCDIREIILFQLNSCFP